MKSKPITWVTLALMVASANAEIVLDSSTGSSGEITPVDGNYSISADLGRQSAANLYHSFSTFNIDTGQTATFSGPDSVSNIVTRVTGGTASNINGRIISTIPDANLWLLNPNGIVFGKGASLDIQGSFHASNADYIQMRDGTELRGQLNRNPFFTSSAPQAFGFISDETIRNSSLKVEGAQLSVPEGESLSLVGSKIDLKGSVMSAPAGQVSVVSINEAGEVYYSDQGFEAYTWDAELKPDAPGNEDIVPDQLVDFSGSLSISSTVFKVEGEHQGNLQIQGGDIEINTHNTDFVSTVSNLKASFFEDVDLLEKPCELAEYYGQGSLAFTVDAEDEETRFGVEVKKARSGALGAFPVPDCL